MKKIDDNMAGSLRHIEYQLRAHRNEVRTNEMARRVLLALPPKVLAALDADGVVLWYYLRDDKPDAARVHLRCYNHEPEGRENWAHDKVMELASLGFQFGTWALSESYDPDDFCRFGEKQFNLSIGKVRGKLRNRIVDIEVKVKGFSIPIGAVVKSNYQSGSRSYSMECVYSR